MALIDAFTLLKASEIKCLQDGFVRLVDCMPRLIPPDRTLEVAVVSSARISTFAPSQATTSAARPGLKGKVVDDNLVRYLYRNGHTSPFESVKFTFHIKCPIFVRTHLIRHRTANINEFSQRYSEVKDGEYYSPLETGIRLQSKTNKQGSITVEDEKAELNELKQLCSHADAHIEDLFGLYDSMIKGGMSRETARYCLPNSTYTELFYTMDLHNLLKFFRLRLDEHTQYETRLIAQAMHDLIAPLVPIAIECLNKYTLQSITLSADDIEAIRARNPELTGSASVSEKSDYVKKLEKLGIKF